METQAPHRGAIALALLFVVSCVLLILFVFRSLGGQVPLSPKGYRVHVSFENAANLVPGADVRMAGVDVGKVVAVKQQALRADATVELDRPYVPLASDARAILRQKTLLGETFVEMTPGSTDAPRITDGGTLAVGQVAPTQTLDRVLDTLDPKTRRNLTVMLSGSAAAFAGRGQDLNDAIGNLDPTTQELASLVAILDRQQTAVQTVVHDGGTVLQTIGDSGASLQRLITAGNAVFATTAQRNAGLQATVAALPPFLGQLQRTLGSVDTSVSLAAPTIAALRPVAPLVRPALADVTVLAPRLRSLVTQFQPLIDVSRRALPAATQIINALIPLSDQLYPAARQVTPVIALIEPHAQDLTATMANVAAALESTGPAQSNLPTHILRTLIPISEESSLGYAQRLPSNRHNAYFAPGEMTNLGSGGLQASDCRDTANPQSVPVFGSGAPPCRVQPGFNFNGATRYFPQLVQAAP